MIFTYKFISKKKRFRCHTAVLFTLLVNILSFYPKTLLTSKYLLTLRVTPALALPGVMSEHARVLWVLYNSNEDA